MQPKDSIEVQPRRLWQSVVAFDKETRVRFLLPELPTGNGGTETVVISCGETRCHRAPATDNASMERGEGFFGRRLSETDKRKALAQTYYDFEVECRRQGWGDPAFVYDEKRNLIR